MKGFVGVAVGACALISRVAAADIDPIVIKGSKFFHKSSGEQFFMKGVAYQQDYSGNGTTSDGEDTYTDPLANEDNCKRDIPYLQQLQTNTIRVYAINPRSNHDACMNLLADAGIYVVADLSAPVQGQSINRDSPTWDADLYARYTSVVDAMAKYDNTLGFFGGNEVSNAPNNTNGAAFVKAAVRDTKAYIKAKGYRTMGVGYATNDDADIRVNMADYFDCGDASAAIDFWGYNVYSWCGDSSYEESGYEDRTKEFSTYNVPTFFAEYGCNTPRPRKFTEVGALYGSKMTSVWSGGIVYMYFEEDNEFGLAKVNGNSISTNSDFDNLKKQMSSVKPSGVQMNSYSPTNSPAACPKKSTDWEAVASPLPPSPNADLCDCMYQSLSCVVSSDVKPQAYGKLFGTVCGLGEDVCKGIAHNSSTGDYGAYGMCNSKEQLGFVFDAYYKSQKNAADACDFGGAATTQDAKEPSGTCDSLMQQAGAEGTGTVTSSPTAGGGSSSGSGSTTSSGAASFRPIAGVQNNMLPVAVVVFLSALSGAGIVLL